MQTSKSRKGSSDVLHKASPITPKSSRGSNKTDSNLDSAALKITPGKISAERSPKITDRRSPRSPVIEKKRPVIKDELKKTKDQLSSSESSKKVVQIESEESKKQLTAMEEMHEESQSQLAEFSSSEDRLQELHKFSQDRESAWQSELEVLQIQHSADHSALTAARNEIQSFKQQQNSKNFLVEENVQNELATLKEDMEATLSSVASLKKQISEKEKAEENTKLTLYETQKQLKIANATIESLHREGCNLQESLTCATTKLEESRIRVSVLEEMVKGLHGSVEDEIERRNPSLEVNDAVSQYKLEQLRAALEAAEADLQEEQVQTTLQIQSVLELAERVKSDAGLRESELELTLQRANAELLETKADLHRMETEFLSLSRTKKELEDEMDKVNTIHSKLEIKLMKATTDTTEMKADILDRETELQNIMEENEQFKLKLGKLNSEHQKNYAAAVLDAERALAAEFEALRRIDAANEEAEKNANRVAKLAEQLESAQAVKLEMEAELKRLRVQSDQWRKAAEAAAAVLTPGNNGKIFGKMGSCDSDHNPSSGKTLSSPLSDDLNDESPKKKNRNVLKKIGELLKKGPK